MKIFTLLVITSLILLPIPSLAEEFVREHTYHAGDDDSKNSSRKKALEQIQLKLLAEVGVYVQSEWEMKETDIDRFASEEIETITAGVTETEILDESWDGFNYRVQAKMEVDIKDARKRLNQVVKERAKRKKLREAIKDNKKELRNKDTEIENLRAELKEAKKKNPKPKKKKKYKSAWDEWEDGKIFWEKLFHLRRSNY